MCGVLGVATVAGWRVTLADEHAVLMRDALAHRGPDGAGLWRSLGQAAGQFLLAHRRLAVLDPTEAGAQPMVRDDPHLGERGHERYAISYNGEIYNDPALRQDLTRRGVCFRSKCDTETLLALLAEEGTAAIGRVRGMFAFAFVDQVARRLTLARDPMGIKPLYYAVTGSEVVFASEAHAILQHPGIAAKPDFASVSAYLTTIRTTMGERTLFDGIRSVRPGEVIEFDLSGPEIRRSSSRIPISAMREDRSGSAADTVRAALADSVGVHLRSDVAMCALLSGGLDSSLLVALAAGELASREAGGVQTYCSGHDNGDESADLAQARAVATDLGTAHHEAPVDRRLFAERWPEMVRRLGVPLSTPNEVAINEVARRMRADGRVVTLSGEGADELFGGYELPMRQAWEWARARIGKSQETLAEDGAAFQIEANAWMNAAIKASALRPEFWKRVERDDALHACYREEFAGVLAEGRTGVQAHLSFHRRVNLAGLLARLDTSTMLEGVEGRTPFADVEICGLAESLPMGDKFEILPDGSSRTKIVLRSAAAGLVPEATRARPKASFPLPFQSWVGDHVGVLRKSALIGELFEPAVVEGVIANPGQLWHLAWPMVNVAMWGERWLE